MVNTKGCRIGQTMQEKSIRIGIETIEGESRLNAFPTSLFTHFHVVESQNVGPQTLSHCLLLINRVFLKATKLIFLDDAKIE